MKSFLLLLLFIFCTSISNAQRFEKYYGGPGADYGVDVAVLSDQSIVSVGTSNSYGHGGDDIVVTKTDSAGLLLWSRYFGGAFNDQGKSVAISTNDDIYVCGVLMGAVAGTEDIQLSKITKDGIVLWTKTYGGSASDIVNDITIKNDSIYMIGSTKSFGAGQEDIYFLSTDTAGTIITTKTIGTTGKDLANSISKTIDGNFLIGGRSDFDITSEVFVAKINIHGDTLWTKRFDCNNPYSTSNFNITANAVIELTDKQILIAGLGVGNTSTFFQAFHLRLDSLGNTIYLKYFGSYTYNYGVDAIAISNGGYIISADYGMMLNKFDNAGASVWSKSYQNVYYGSGYQNSNFARTLVNLSNGQFLFTGTAYILNSTNDIYIAKLDSNGFAYSSSNPVITPAGLTTFCQGDSVLLTSPTGYTSYQWIKSTTTGVKTYYPGNLNTLYAKEDGGYICVLTKSDGTRLTPYLRVTVNQFPTATVTASGPLSFCAASGQSVTLTAPSGYSSYQWSKVGVSIAGATANTLVANKTGKGYKVAISNGCGTRSSSGITIIANNPPTCSISCSGSDCTVHDCHQSDNLIATNNGLGTTYKWYNGSFFVQSSSSNTYSPNAGIITCKVTTGCGTATSAPFTIYSSTLSNNTIQTNVLSSGCGTPSSIILTAPNTSSTFFQWYFNSNIIAGATSSTYTALTAGDYTVSYHNYSSNCFSTMSQNLQFRPSVDSLAILSAPSGTNTCTGTLPLTVNVSGAGYNYKWYKDNNIISSANTQTIQVSSSGTFKCEVNRPSCGYQTTNSISFNFGNPIFTTPIVNINICPGGSKNIYIYTNSTFYTYQWKLNGAIISGANAYNYNTIQPGTFTCEVSNACSTITSTPIVVTQVALPIPVISALGNTSLCPGQICALSTSLISGSNYYWKNGTSYASYGTNLNNYNATSLGSYTVTVTDPNGCTGISAPLVITSTSVPIASLFVTDYPLICYGSQLLLKGASYINANYVWYLNNIIIPGAVDSFYNSIYGGDYNYKVTNACGSAISNSTHVYFKSRPTATITALSSTTFCNGDSVVLQAALATTNKYVWYKNNAVISNAKNDNYTAKQAGTYLTKVTNEYGCFKQSNSIIVTVPCRTSDDTEINDFDLNAINVYPNPSNDVVYFEVPTSSTSKTLQVSVYDTQGRLITISMDQINDNLWMVNNLDAGMYILKVSDDTKTVSRSFVVIK